MTDLTLSGPVLGSPSYLPPEQASGRRGDVGPHTDIYALGAVLYHLWYGEALKTERPVRSAAMAGYWLLRVGTTPPGYGL